MRAVQGFAAIGIVAACTALATALDGMPRAEHDALRQPAREQRQAPVPLGAWTGLAIIGALAACRHLRRDKRS